MAIFFTSIWFRLVPIILSGFALMYATWAFFRVATHRFRDGVLPKLILLVGGFRILYPILQIIGQYAVWSQSELTRVFLNQPVHASVPIPDFLRSPLLLGSHLGYFLFYSWGRFWLSALLSLGATLAIFVLLRIWQKFSASSVSTAEVRSGTLAALAVGWPLVLVWIPLSLFAAAFTAVFRRFLPSRLGAHLEVPFLVSGLIALVAGGWLLEALHLAVFRI